MDKLYEKALSSGLATPGDIGIVCGAYLDYMRRRCGKIEKGEDGKAVEDDKLRLLRDSFDQAVELLANMENSQDEIARVAQYAARFEAKHCFNMEGARKIWADQIFPLGFNINYNMQMEFINLERAYGSLKHCRRHFHKALNSSQMDYPDALFDAYVTFEREEGSLDDYLEARAFVEKQRKTFKDREDKKAEKEQKMAAKKSGEKRPYNGVPDKRQNG